MRWPLLAASPLSPALLQIHFFLDCACASWPCRPTARPSCRLRSPAQSYPPSLLRTPLAVVRRPPASSPRSRVLRATNSHSGLLGPAVPFSDHLFLHTTGSPTPPLPGNAALLFNPPAPSSPRSWPRWPSTLAYSARGCSGTAIPALPPNPASPFFFSHAPKGLLLSPFIHSSPHLNTRDPC